MFYLTSRQKAKKTLKNQKPKTKNQNPKNQRIISVIHVEGELEVNYLALWKNAFRF